MSILKRIFRTPVNRDNAGIILFLNENKYCDPSFELSLCDGSNEGSQGMFLWEKKVVKNFT